MELEAAPIIDARERSAELSRFVPVLAVVCGVLLVAGTALNAYIEALGLTSRTSFLVFAAGLLNPNAEVNLLMWASTLLLASVALGLAAIGFAARGTGPYPWRFAALASVALFLSADEAAMLHERLSFIAERFNLELVSVWGWLTLGVPLAVIVGVGLLWIARGIDRLLRRRLIVAGAVFLTGAAGFEAISWYVAKNTELEPLTQLLVHHVLVLCEEGLELAGALLALWAVLRHLELLRRG